MGIAFISSSFAVRFYEDQYLLIEYDDVKYLRGHHNFHCFPVSTMVYRRRLWQCLKTNALVCRWFSLCIALSRPGRGCSEKQRLWIFQSDAAGHTPWQQYLSDLSVCNAFWDCVTVKAIRDAGRWWRFVESRGRYGYCFVWSFSEHVCCAMLPDISYVWLPKFADLDCNLNLQAKGCLSYYSMPGSKISFPSFLNSAGLFNSSIQGCVPVTT